MNFDRTIFSAIQRESDGVFPSPATNVDSRKCKTKRNNKREKNDYINDIYYDKIYTRKRFNAARIGSRFIKITKTIGTSWTC